MDAWAEEALALIRKHPADPAALAVIGQYLDGRDTDTGELARLVRAHQMEHPELGRLISHFARSVDKEAKESAKELAAKHPSRTIRGQASYSVGMVAKWELVENDFPRWKSYRKPTEAELLALQTQAETYLNRAMKDYADVPLATGDGQVGRSAAAELAGLKNLPNLRAGKPAPEIEGEDLDGKKMRLSDHRGKVVLLVFWASWCGPCMADVPHERELVEKLNGRPFVLVGVNGDESHDKARAAAARSKMTWRSFGSGGERGRGLIPVAWNVTSWPTTYVIDHRGVIRHRNLRQADLDKPVEALVAEAEAAKR